MSDIYRKSSLEKLSSPEQLDKMIHITKTSGWIALFGMLLMILAAGYWAFFGELREKISTNGICMEAKQESINGNTDSTDSVGSETDNLHIYSYVPLSIGKRIQVGMKANVLPSTVNKQETGYLLGKVVKVGNYGISKEEMLEKLGDDLLVKSFRNEKYATEPIIEVEIQLYKDDSSKNGYAWSNQNGGNVSISDFTMVNVYIIMNEMTPFQKFTSFL